jgi:1-deoxy-D-xylulose-5-phosphate reductoisomerase
MRSVTILGASGSIGASAANFLRLHRDRFELKNIAVNGDWEAALRIALEFGCRAVAVSDAAAAAELRRQAPAGAFDVIDGPDAAAKIAADKVDVVLAAVAGSAGLPSVLSALRAGNRVALANKESMVCGGRALLDLAAANGVEILPVDSEHSAIFQAMLAGKREEVASIVLTASGGPFRTTPIEQMRAATPEQALAHPNWSMGAKITIDSATLANKGLELIEAAYLFDKDERDVEVVINPTSILHSAVQFRDGSMIAQLGLPDMRPPIALALSWPDRLETGVKSLSLAELGKLEFQAVDLERFPCLGLARACLRAPGGPLLFNAANEIAVAAFLERRIGFMEIPEFIAECLEAGAGRFACALDDILETNQAALAFSRSRLLARAA